MKTAITHLVGSLFIIALLNCSSHDIGEACYPEGTGTISETTVSGENPVVEIVALQRSIDCETFQCLTYGGYESFCTRTCKYDSEKGSACSENSNCESPKHCFEGYCRDDDCPAGFECRTIQDVGPLAGNLYCVYKTGCSGSNRNCEALGEMECRRIGCFDQALLSTDSTTTHTLGCKSLDSLSYCLCADGSNNCGSAGLVCTPPGSEAWPAGSVDLRDVCMRTE
ncbi:MAG: hypothetical protein JW841_14280 [Deltaproteobacteria bacterium]|nr:hypothetical protein [Deltaproteobacteria bacterium]